MEESADHKALGHSHRAIESKFKEKKRFSLTLTQMEGINACKSIKKIKLISHMESRGCGVSKAYLQHERHSSIRYDNDDQCGAPVVGNTHNLRGGRAAGTEVNAAVAETRTHSWTVLQRHSLYGFEGERK